MNGEISLGCIGFTSQLVVESWSIHRQMNMGFDNKTKYWTTSVFFNICHFDIISHSESNISCKPMWRSNTTYLSSERCFSTFLHLFLSPSSLSNHNQVCKARTFLWLSISITHSTSLLPPLSLSLGSVFVQILNINWGRLRSRWSAVPSLICWLPHSTDVSRAAGVILVISISSFKCVCILFICHHFCLFFCWTSPSSLAHIFVS